MQKLNTGRFWEFGAILSSVAQIPYGSTLSGEVAALLSRARSALNFYSDANVPLSLSVSRPTAEALLSAIDGALSALPSPPDDQIRYMDEVVREANKFNFIIIEELNGQPIYHVFPKRAYDMNILINDATRLFSEETRAALSDIATFDIMEAGRCLAFELPTAAKFHLMRAVEDVIKAYYTIVVGSVPPQKLRNWGAYIKNLRKSTKSDLKILAALEQMKDLHRNPVFHPDERVTIEEASSLVGLAESTISLMMVEIKRLQNPPFP